MPLIPILLGVGGLGAGYVLGIKTDKIITTLVIGGVVYYYITKSK